MTREAREQGLQLSRSEVCREIYMSQNLLLEYNGGTPQQALTGQTSKGWWTPEADIIQQTAGAKRFS